MSESVNVSPEKARGIPSWVVLLFGLIAGFVIGWLFKESRPPKIAVGIGYVGEGTVTARTEDNRVVELPQAADNGFPQKVLLLGPNEPITFEAKIADKTITQTVYPFTLGPHLQAQVRVVGDQIEFQFRQPK